MNDATRRIGGVLGVAIVGSIVASTYASSIADAASGMPIAVRDTTSESVGAATAVAGELEGGAGQALLQTAQEAFIHAADRGVLIAVAVALAGAIVVWLTLPARTER